MSERTDSGPILGSGWMHLFATILAVLGGVLCFAWYKNPEMRSIGLIALGAGLVPWTINGYRLYRLRSALGPADLRLEDPIPLGFSGTATYFRTLNGAELASVEARLQCLEEIVRGSGKNKTRVSRVVHDEPLTPVVTPMMERIEVRVPLRIPATGPSSFRCETANTTWWVRLRLKMRGCPNTASSFQVEVAPGLAQR